MDLSPTIKRIQAGDVNFRKLPTRLRCAIVGFLKCEGMLGEEIAELLRVPRSTVFYWWERYQLIQQDLVRRMANKAIGRLFSKAEHLYSRAVKAKDYRLAWDIEKDLLSALVKLGLEVNPPAAAAGDDAKTLPPAGQATELERQLQHDLEILGRIKRRGIPEAGSNGNGSHLPGEARERGDEGAGEDLPGGA